MEHVKVTFSYRKSFLLFLLFVSIASKTTEINANDGAATGAMWSREAHPLNYIGGARKLKFDSPDGKKSVIINDSKLEIIVNGKKLPGMKDASATSLAELEWAPNSNSLFVTQSLGGFVGEFRVTVFVIRLDSVQSLDVSVQAMREFEKHYECIEAEEPNIGAVKWMDDSKSLLLVTEVPPHSSCPDMGKLGGYIVAVPTGRIISVYSENELRAGYGESLGTRFTKK